MMEYTDVTSAELNKSVQTSNCWDFYRFIACHKFRPLETMTQNIPKIDFVAFWIKCLVTLNIVRKYMAQFIISIVLSSLHTSTTIFICHLIYFYSRLSLLRKMNKIFFIFYSTLQLIAYFKWNEEERDHRKWANCSARCQIIKMPAFIFSHRIKS